MRTIVGTLSFLFIASTYACGGDTIIVRHEPADGGDTDSAVDTDANGPDTSIIPPNTNYPAFKVDAPQVVSGGGPQLTNAKIIPVFFSNDDNTFTAQVVDFLSKLPSSKYWGPPTIEYGVGLPTLAPTVTLVEAAPKTTTDAAIQTWLAARLGSSALPAPDANSLYMLYYPAGTTITQGQGQSCQTFGGYHNSISYNGKPLAYAVMPRCANFGPLNGIGAVTGTSSHEIIEAVTDPYPQQDPGYAQVDANHIAWEFVLGGGETGDMCAQFRNAFYKDLEIGYAVQRSWSNKSALAGHDPCLPLDGSVYFNSMPLLTEKVLIGGQFNTKAVTIPVGQSKVIELDLFSDGPTTGGWYVTATDLAAQRGQAPELDFTFDKQSGQNGDKINMTVKVLKASQYNAEAFIVSSTLGSRENLWVGLVAN